MQSIQLLPGDLILSYNFALLVLEEATLARDRTTCTFVVHELKYVLLVNNTAAVCQHTRRWFDTEPMNLLREGNKVFSLPIFGV